MARFAEDVALMLQAIAGPVRSRRSVSRCRPRLSGRGNGRDARGLRVAYAADPAGIGVDPDVESVCRDAAFALRDGGAAVSEVPIDLAFARPAFLALRGLWFVTHLKEYLSERDRFGTNVANNVHAGLETTVEQLAEAEQARNRAWSLCRDLFRTRTVICHAVHGGTAVPGRAELPRFD